MVKGMNRFEFFVTRRRIKPYVSNDLHERVKNPVKFMAGRTVAYGFESDTLIDIAEAVIRADNAGTLQTQQAAIAYQCRVITSSLTRVQSFA